MGRILLTPPDAPSAVRDERLNVLKSNAAEVDRLIGVLMQTSTDANLLAMVQDFDAIHKAAFNLQIKIVTLHAEGKTPEAIALYHGDGQAVGGRTSGSTGLARPLA